MLFSSQVVFIIFQTKTPTTEEYFRAYSET